jgi:hypothetical protein
MLGSSSWMPYAPQGVKGLDDATSYLQVRSSTPKMVAAGSSNRVTRYQIIRCHTPEDNYLLMKRDVTISSP